MHVHIYIIIHTHLVGSIDWFDCLDAFCERGFWRYDALWCYLFPGKCVSSSWLRAGVKPTEDMPLYRFDACQRRHSGWMVIVRYRILLYACVCIVLPVLSDWEHVFASSTERSASTGTRKARVARAVPRSFGKVHNTYLLMYDKEARQGTPPHSPTYSKQPRSAVPVLWPHDAEYFWWYSLVIQLRQILQESSSTTTTTIHACISWQRLVVPCMHGWLWSHN